MELFVREGEKGQVGINELFAPVSMGLKSYTKEQNLGFYWFFYIVFDFNFFFFWIVEIFVNF